MGPTRDPHPWRAALWLTGGLVAYGMAWGFWLSPAFTHTHGWLPPLDSWHILPPARAVVEGHVGRIYSSDRYFVAGPLAPVLFAPVAAVIRWRHLTEAYPTQIPHPTSWWVFGPYGLASTAVVLYAARALATEAGVVRGRTWLQLWMVMPLYSAAVVYGHYEDVLALGLVMLAARDLLRGRAVGGAIWLSVGIATKQWAALAVPLYVAVAPEGRRFRSLTAALALPAALVGFTLAIDWHHASKALFAANTYPQAGHAALWVSRQTRVLIGTPTRLGAFVVAIAIAWWLRGRGDPPTLLAGLAAIFLARLLFEPVLYEYYAAAGLAFALLHEKVARGHVWRTFVIGTAWLFWFQVANDGWWWWAVSYPAIAALGLPALRDVARARAVRDRDRTDAVTVPVPTSGRSS